MIEFEIKVVKKQMSSIHDYEIDSYSVDFKKNMLIMNVSSNQYKKQIIFYDVFCYRFYEEMPYSIIFDLEERPIESFYTENKELLIQTKNYVWPIMYDSLQELAAKIKDSNLHYQVLTSSYGLNGWILAERVEIVTIK
ncbi:hypothetical protein ACWOCD_04010 [Enterococcus silesiacus]|uniref:hypothetical protein n=1 Tax=Enterococcus silesiacus TaxID=332949 RepID=UPI001114BF79|nr:hypothetical protein [Enterococcus silesiacus]